MAYLGVIAALIALVCVQFAGTFADRVTVRAELTATGDALAPGSDVKMRGVLIGRVGSIERVPGRSGAIVELRLDPGSAGRVPAGVSARSLPANFFGQSYVELLAPAAGPVGISIRSGAVIAQDTSQETVELQDVFAKLFRVLTAVQPAKLSTALGALAEALDGRGAKVGELIERTDAYLRALRPHLPTLRADLTALAQVAETAARLTPSLLDSVDDVLVLARTLVQRQAQFVELLSGGLELSRNAAGLLEDNTDATIRVVRQGRQIIGAFGRNPAAFSSGFVDLGAFLGTLAERTDGKIGLDTRIEPGTMAPYGPPDCPRYPGLAGPNCPAGGAGFAQLPAQLRVAAVHGGIGGVGSVTDKVVLAEILTAIGGRSAGDVGILLAGSLLRGSTVLVPEGAR